VVNADALVLLLPGEDEVFVLRIGSVRHRLFEAGRCTVRMGELDDLNAAAPADVLGALLLHDREKGVLAEALLGDFFVIVYVF